MPSHRKTKRKKKGRHSAATHTSRDPSLSSSPITSAIPLPNDSCEKGLSSIGPPKSGTQRVHQDYTIPFQVLHLDRSRSDGPIGTQRSGTHSMHTYDPSLQNSEFQNDPVPTFFNVSSPFNSPTEKFLPGNWEDLENFISQAYIPLAEMGVSAEALPALKVRELPQGFCIDSFWLDSAISLASLNDAMSCNPSNPSFRAPKPQPSKLPPLSGERELLSSCILRKSRRGPSPVFLQSQAHSRFPVIRKLIKLKLACSLHFRRTPQSTPKPLTGGWMRIYSIIHALRTKNSWGPDVIQQHHQTRLSDFRKAITIMDRDLPRMHIRKSTSMFRFRTTKLLLQALLSKKDFNGLLYHATLSSIIHHHGVVGCNLTSSPTDTSRLQQVSTYSLNTPFGTPSPPSQPTKQDSLRNIPPPWILPPSAPPDEPYYLPPGKKIKWLLPPSGVNWSFARAPLSLHLSLVRLSAWLIAVWFPS